MAYKYGIDRKYTVVYIRSIFGNAEFLYAREKKNIIVYFLEKLGKAYVWKLSVKEIRNH